VLRQSLIDKRLLALKRLGGAATWPVPYVE